MENISLDRFLFRGFSNTKVWVFGSLIYHGEQPIIEFVKKRHPEDNRVLATDWVYVDPKSVSVFVLKYKNLDIFEGDIIHLKTDTIDRDFGVVVWHPNGSFICDDYFGAYDITDRSGKPIGAILQHIELQFKDSNCEISINGNIYERPEVITKNVVPF